MELVISNIFYIKEKNAMNSKIDKILISLSVKIRSFVINLDEKKNTKFAEME